MTNIYINPACETQLDLEAKMLDLGKEKFRARLDKERQRGQVANAGATSRVIDHIYPAMALRPLALAVSLRRTLC